MATHRRTSGTDRRAQRSAAVDVQQIEAAERHAEARLAVEIRNGCCSTSPAAAGATSPTHQLTHRADLARIVGHRRHHHGAARTWRITASTRPTRLTEIATGKIVVTGTTFARVSYDIPGQAAALRAPARPARRREPRGQGDRRQHPLAARVVFRRRDLSEARPSTAQAGDESHHGRAQSRRNRSVCRAARSGAAGRAGLRPGRRAGARARRDARQRLGRRSRRSVLAGAARRRRLLAEPARLVEEANTMPLFGGRRAVWVKAGSRNIAAAVEAVLAAPPARLPRRDRGRRSQAQRAAAQALRAREERRRDPLLRRRRARARAADRRGDARGRPDDRAGCARRAGAAARRRPPGLAQRNAEARACTRMASGRSTSTT